ncbi:MAG: GNAT family N-acetyltransferase [Acidimicrobiales bacterium]
MPTLEPISLDELERLSPSLERLVDQTPSIDRWCSSPDWALSTNLAFAPDSPRYVAGDPATGVALLAAHEHAHGVTLSGLEPMWGFGSPILGADPVAVTRLLVAGLAHDNTWHSLVLPGLPLSAPVLTAIAEALSALGDVRVGTAIEREMIDLTDGVDAWLARRSPRFRRNLRRAERAAELAGVRYEPAGNGPDVFDRLLAIEARSWKGKEGSGITAPDMATMYRSLTERLASKGTLRATVAIRDDHDVGFILGGVRVRFIGASACVCRRRGKAKHWTPPAMARAARLGSTRYGELV